MAKKGDNKTEKRLAASRVIPLHRKKYTWNVKAKPGPHKRRNSVAVGFVLRDLIGITKNMKETKRILNAGSVLVDGKVVKDYRLPVGLFDLITVVPEEKTYRVSFSKNGKIGVLEEEKHTKEKICKVVGKRVVSKGLVQLTTNDGRSFSEKAGKAAVGDSLLVEVPGQKIVQAIKLEPGKVALVVDGTHIGEVAKVKEITPGTMTRPKLVLLEAKESQFKTVESNIVAVGSNKPVIRVE
jgi:small subunit ribosomal protein S4e